jgi:hypothetical protein
MNKNMIYALKKIRLSRAVTVPVSKICDSPTASILKARKLKILLLKFFEPT